MLVIMKLLLNSYRSPYRTGLSSVHRDCQYISIFPPYWPGFSMTWISIQLVYSATVQAKHSLLENIPINVLPDIKVLNLS